MFFWNSLNQKPDSLDKNLRWQKNIEEKNVFTIEFYNLELVEINNGDMDLYKFHNSIWIMPFEIRFIHNCPYSIPSHALTFGVVIFGD